MHPRCNKLQVGAICFAVMAFGWEAHAQDLTTRTTGCLGSNGNFSLFALGNNPLGGCPAGENQVSLKLDDLADGAATVPFFVTLRFGEERIIAENGALRLRARCIFGSGISGDSLDLVVSSTLDGWLATSAGRSTTTELRAQDEVILSTAAGRPDQGRLSGFGDDRLTGAQLALAPDGSFLALSPGSTALGVNLFDQDCLAVGTVSLIRGNLPAPPGVGQPLQGSNTTSGAVATGNQIVGAVNSDGVSVGVTIGNTSGALVTGMSPISGGIAPPLGGGISSLGNGTPLSDGGIPSLGGGISSLGGSTPLADGGIPSLGGGISSLGGATPLSDGGIPSLGGGISSLGGATPLSDGGIASLGSGISAIGQ